MKWHERLEQEMRALGWNKAELSRRAGIPYDSVNKYLRGDIDSILPGTSEQTQNETIPTSRRISACKSTLRLIKSPIK